MRACLKSPYSAASAAFALILRGLRLTGLRACSPQPTVSHGKIDPFATKGDFKQALSLGEDRVKRLIHNVLAWGVWGSAAIMILGLALYMGGDVAHGEKCINYGIFVLIFTPVARLLMLCIGYALAGERKFALISAIVTAIVISGLIIKK